MTDPSIDQSKLPGVKEVCRDFAVLEDHTLAYNLQEQEIENHLASNIQRTRLVQHDLLVAKKLQEEEDLKAQARIQKRHKDLEHQDSEIAQEIQEKLVIEAEERLRQEEKDEDIARKLQEREKKRQTKQATERQGHELLEDGYYQETRDRSRGKHKEYEHDRPRRHRSHERHHKPPSESKHSQSRFYTDVSDQQPCVEENPRKPCRDQEARRPRRHEEHCDRSNSWNERPIRPPPPRSVRDADVDAEHAARQPLTNSGKPRSHSQDDLCSRACQDGKRHDSEALKRSEYRKGTGSKEIRDATYGKMRPDVKQLELQDAQIARQLQEEELRATRSDMQAAQVAQDEEIARLLMAKEKKAYKRAKMLDKMPSDKRRQEPEWQSHAVEHTHPRSRDGYEVHGSKKDKPARPPPPPTLTDYAEFKGPQHGSTRPANRSESAYKGSSHC
ncbi:coiled-coil domain-containing protein 50 isoform X2 [Microcaecilia unicolor]|uniref:Coiled-coil domain-containing protein 50 isoform X2 n=1 Tax=Microcaecilia unicolor TaxID=1415580 RepID=A0A6P7Z2X1_9AMPH|nr:coiled-coil domain-containing protein 50 isoform X2 [Microcaecilia unicolor]